MGVKGALSVLDTVKVVDDVMLIRYNIKKSLGYSKKHPSNVRLRNFLVLYLCFVLREVSLITVYFCYHVWCTLSCLFSASCYLIVVREIKICVYAKRQKSDSS